MAITKNKLLRDEIENISAHNAARIIGVSTATIRNWVKAGDISVSATKPLSFTKKEILALKENINSGKILRLTTRANKSQSKEFLIPAEYAANFDIIKPVIEIYKTHNLDIEAVLFFAALRLVHRQGEVKIENIFAIDSFVWKRASLKNEFLKWHSALKDFEKKKAYCEIYEIADSGDNEDFFGLLYQSLSSVGAKFSKGAYYTPADIVEASIKSGGSHVIRFVDPCCGTGKYLLTAAKILRLKPENIYGFDSDHIAVKLARINLLLFYKGKGFSPHIYCLNSLTDTIAETFDLVATNPPWGAIDSRLQGNEKYFETFSQFIIKSLSILKGGGRLSFILPESILKTKIHSAIREHILRKTQISRIVKLGRRFSGVFTDCIRLDLINEPAKQNTKIAIEEGNTITTISQSRFLANPNYAFTTNISDADEAFLKKIFSVKHTTLKGHADWALGVVTGNNKKYVLSKKLAGTEPLYKGSDVHKYTLCEPKSFIKFEPSDFQQVAPAHYYRAKEKLVYKFISNRLTFAYDNGQALTLNSANILMPKLPDMHIKVVLAYLNSDVFQYISRKLFSTHKVLRGNLEMLPFPVIDNATHDKIVRLVDNILAGKDEHGALEEIIFSTFHLNKKDQAIIFAE